ncbi:MAG: lysophospholipase [Actinomycetota bacterium]|nr:lysophospholipase [Actinomycetota bacterium]
MNAVMEHPLFVPVGAGHTAAVLAVPEGEARALVLLLPGFGVGRSHKTRIWTLVARGLAERDIASIRIDYQGHGDSTGSVEKVELDTPAMDEAVAATDLGKDLVGVESVGVVGNCFGARTAVSFAEHRDDCRSAALVLPGGFNVLFEARAGSGPMDPAGNGAGGRGRGARSILGALRRRPPRPRGEDANVRFIPEVSRALASTDLLFVLPGIEERRRILQDAIDELPAANGDGRGGHVAVETLRASNAMSANIPVEAQPALVDMLVTWMDRTMPSRAEPAPAARADGP